MGEVGVRSTKGYLHEAGLSSTQHAGEQRWEPLDQFKAVAVDQALPSENKHTLIVIRDIAPWNEMRDGGRVKCCGNVCSLGSFVCACSDCYTVITRAGQPYATTRSSSVAFRAQ